MAPPSDGMVPWEYERLSLKCLAAAGSGRLCGCTTSGVAGHSRCLAQRKSDSGRDDQSPSRREQYVWQSRTTDGVAASTTPAGEAAARAELESVKCIQLSPMR